MVTVLIEYLTGILEYIDRQMLGRACALPRPKLTTPLHDILARQHMWLVDKCLFTMMLMQLKAAALLQVLQNYLLKPNCLPINNMKT